MRSRNLPWIIAIILGLVLILTLVLCQPWKNSNTHGPSLVKIEDAEDANASRELEKNIKIVSSSSSPKLVIESLEPKVTPTNSLSITNSIDNVEFIGDAGFSFLKSSTGAMLPVFYFRKNLLNKVGQENKTPYLYKSSKGSVAPKFKERGDYYFTIDAGKKIYPAKGKEAIITSNAYLGMKKNGYEAWLAYELEENGYMDVGEKVSLLYDPNTKGINFAIKVRDWAPRSPR